MRESSTHPYRCGKCSSIFFFSSRRRHTRYIGDWSSDVCSSDLEHPLAEAIVRRAPNVDVWPMESFMSHTGRGASGRVEIGRASCRERVWMLAVEVALRKERTVIPESVVGMVVVTAEE